MANWKNHFTNGTIIWWVAVFVGAVIIALVLVKRVYG